MADALSHLKCGNIQIFMQKQPEMTTTGFGDFPETTSSSTCAASSLWDDLLKGTGESAQASDDQPADISWTGLEFDNNFDAAAPNEPNGGADGSHIRSNETGIRLSRKDGGEWNRHFEY